MFTVRSSSYNLRRNHILALPNPKTTTYGLHSFSYLATKIWNSLPDTYKTLNFLEFKQEILRYEAFPRQPQQIYKLYFPLHPQCCIQFTNNIGIVIQHILFYFNLFSRRYQLYSYSLCMYSVCMYVCKTITALYRKKSQVIAFLLFWYKMFKGSVLSRLDQLNSYFRDIQYCKPLSFC